MAHKKLKFDTDVRSAPERDVNKLAGAVKITLGPRGQYGVLGRAFGGPTVTNDGVTIARQVELEDVFENQGAQLAPSMGSLILTAEAVVAKPPPRGDGAAAVSRAGHNMEFM